jgi:murein DD-endopeptidase MepM/ murein hydrolase activator NlpD
MKEYLYSLLLFVIGTGLHPRVNAQFFEKKEYPQQYFQWPVAAKIALVANFGELRPNHFHMGLDCRTDQAENKPVYAAAEGFIAKVKIEASGFGRSIYINHPNGLSTLYAHLNDFNPALEQYVKEQQYLLQKWNVTLDIPAKMFPVAKGTLIAYSGNTGGSQGPHLHFEIRDTKTDKVLNPLLFGFPITDNIAPNVLRLAVYDRSKSTFEQTPKIYPLKKVNGVYVPVFGKLLINAPKVSFAITAYDRYTGSTNQNGIYEAVLYDNNKAIAGFQIDSISYLETRYLNAHIDYKLRANGGSYLQHLSRLPGNHSSIYKTDDSNGVIDLTDHKEHNISISVSDANGNSSNIQFDIATNYSAELSPVMIAENQVKFQPGFINIFENDQICFYLGENALYDSFYFHYKESKDLHAEPIYQLHNASIPLQQYFTLKIKENFLTRDTGRVVMRRFYGAKDDYVKASFENGWYKAAFREMGNFQLMIDSIPPSISAIGFVNNMNVSKLSRLLFVVTDNTEVIKKFTALLDGKWLRFTNDKGRNFIYKFDEYCSSGSHELVITAEDQVGNITQKIYNFSK